MIYVRYDCETRTFHRHTHTCTDKVNTIPRRSPPGRGNYTDSMRIIYPPQPE